MKEFIIADKQRLDEVYREIAHDIQAKPIKITISDLRGKTKKQLGYYWSTIVPIITKELNERGLASAMLTEADVNEVLNRKFFSKQVLVDGEIQTFSRSKASASMDEMKKFIFDVKNWCANMDIFIPPPLADDIF